MRSTLILFLLAATALAAPQPLDTSKAQKNRAEAKIAADAGEETATWAGSMDEFKADKATLATRQDAFDADMVTATNKIAQIDNVAKAKTACEKMQNEIDDLNKCIASLKQMVIDLKKAMVAERQGK
jgi:hypothetical protein